MKKRTYEGEIRAAVALSLGHYGVYPEDVAMPCRSDGMVSVDLRRDPGSTFRTWELFIPNWQLAEMIHGDNWDGDCVDGAFRFGGGGCDPVWFECGVNG